MEKYKSLGKLRIILVGEMPPKPGGAAKFVKNILDSKVLKDGFEFIQFDITNSNKIAKTDKNSIPLLGVFRRLKKAGQLISIVSKVKPHIIHYNSFGDYSFLSDFLNIAILKIFKRKIILHFHNDPTSIYNHFPSIEYNWKSAIFRKAMLKTNLTIFTGKKFSDYAKGKFGLTKVDYLNNSVAPVYFERNQYSRKQNTIVKVLYMGRLSKLKGIYDFIGIMKELLILNKAKFFIAGNYNTIEDKVSVENELKAIPQNSYELLGVIGDKKKEEVLMETDILLFPSYYESFGISIIEAASYGIPTIAYNIGMISEIIEQGKTGYISPVGDWKAMKDYLLNMIKEQTYFQMGLEAKMKVIDEYSFKKFENKLMDIYTKVAIEC
jgi:glycosyltransferase involved in cell wall biosynthesis